LHRATCSALSASGFVYEGLDYLLNNAFQQRDYPVMQGVFLIITMMVIVANLLADLLQARPAHFSTLSPSGFACQHGACKAPC
jgi:ABC-type microcin C transport system permease subunit YejB